MANKIVTVLFLLATLPAWAAAKEPRNAPADIIVLPLNGMPVEVTERHVRRYQCAEGQLVASSEGVGYRTPARQLTLRCLPR
jgi:hypothetical protein